MNKQKNIWRYERHHLIAAVSLPPNQWLILSLYLSLTPFPLCSLSRARLGWKVDAAWINPRGSPDVVVRRDYPASPESAESSAKSAFPAERENKEREDWTEFEDYWWATTFGGWGNMLGSGWERGRWRKRRACARWKMGNCWALTITIQNPFPLACTRLPLADSRPKLRSATFKITFHNGMWKYLFVSMLESGPNSGNTQRSRV